MIWNRRKNISVKIIGLCQMRKKRNQNPIRWHWVGHGNYEAVCRADGRHHHG